MARKFYISVANGHIGLRRWLLYRFRYSAFHFSVFLSKLSPVGLVALSKNRIIFIIDMPLNALPPLVYT